MDYTSGYITIESLLSLNIAEVQAHLNLVQWSIANELDSYSHMFSAVKQEPYF